MNEAPSNKILIVRMLEVGEVASIGIPVIRHIRRKNPEAELHFLTYAKGADIIALAEPNVKLLNLEAGQWPDNILQAMETFLGIAEDIIGQAYSQILNFDTAFMPCFLTRFLKDAGEPVHGNYMNCSVQVLIDQLQSQTLRAEFVNDSAEYLSSTFFGMARWHTEWWTGENVPEHGYPEYYLKLCCGFTDLEMNNQIEVSSQHGLSSDSRHSNTIVLASQDPSLQNTLTSLRELLIGQGYKVVWLDESAPVRQVLQRLAEAKLLVASVGAEHWYASAVGCPTLLICGDIDPRLFMPDYATDTGHLPSAEELAEGIASIFAEQINA